MTTNSAIQRAKSFAAAHPLWAVVVTALLVACISVVILTLMFLLGPFGELSVEVSDR